MSKKKYIVNLDEFNNEVTFARLLDRADHLERLILQVKRIRSLDTILLNALSSEGIDILNWMMDQTELFSVFYRSMFQASKWEATLDTRIDPMAYNIDGTLITLHKKVTDHVNKTTAHQDEDDDNRRYVYMNIKNQQGDTCHLVSRNIQYHIDYLAPHIAAMQKAIKRAFSIKFGYELKISISNDMEHTDMAFSFFPSSRCQFCTY